MPTLTPQTSTAPRGTEADMIHRFADRHGLSLSPTTVTLRSGALLRVDGSDGSTHVRAHSVHSPLGHVDLAALVQDVFALALLRSAHPYARTVLLVQDAGVRDALRARIVDTPAAAAVEIVVL